MLDLTFGPSFKVKRWFTGFGELSFWWIQIYIGSPMRRSSLNRYNRSHDTENHCGYLMSLDLAKSPFVKSI